MTRPCPATLHSKARQIPRKKAAKWLESSDLVRYAVREALLFRVTFGKIYAAADGREKILMGSYCRSDLYGAREKVIAVRW
jgi:hypothetical protein